MFAIFPLEMTGIAGMKGMVMRFHGKNGMLLFVAALLASFCMPAQAAGVKADAVNELTPDAGVTVDGVTAQDGHVALPEVAAPADTTGKLYNEGGALRWNGVQLDQTSGVDATTLGDGSVSNTEFETLDGVTGPLQTQLDDKAADADLTTHTGDMDNPHSVTATQLGLGSVDNTADTDKPVSTDTQTALDAKADDADLTAHTGDTDNPHGVTAAQLGLGSVDNTADADKPISTATQTALDGKLPYTGDAYIVVKTTSNAATNATNLRAAYTAAKALTPNGSGLSATNRAVVFVPPGQYDLGASTFTMDTDYVDVVGLSTAREDQHIYRSSGHVLSQTAADVRIENLFLHYTGTSTSINAYYPNATWNTSHNGSPPATTIRNCEFRVNSTSCRSMRSGVEYAGTYEDCLAGGLYAFGYDGTASGTFTNCTGGNGAFGNDGTASGTFTNCTGGNGAFGNDGTASGTFTNCTGGTFAFGGGLLGTASGDFTNCTGDTCAFGGDFLGTASGTFANCTGGDYSFGGGTGGTASGTFNNCTGGNDAFGGNDDGNASGTFNNCTGGIGAFGGDGGSADGGKFFHCFGGVDSFTGSGTPAPYHHVCFQNGALYSGND